MSQRQPTFLKVPATAKRPLLYVPGIYKSLPVQPGEIYQVVLDQEELSNILEGGQMEIAEPASFTDYFSVVATSKVGDEFVWEKQRA